MRMPPKWLRFFRDALEMNTFARTRNLNCIPVVTAAIITRRNKLQPRHTNSPGTQWFHQQTVLYPRDVITHIKVVNISDTVRSPSCELDQTTTTEVVEARMVLTPSFAVSVVTNGEVCNHSHHGSLSSYDLLSRYHSDCNRKTGAMASGLSHPISATEGASLAPVRS